MWNHYVNMNIFFHPHNFSLAHGSLFLFTIDNVKKLREKKYAKVTADKHMIQCWCGIMLNRVANVLEDKTDFISLNRIEYLHRFSHQIVLRWLCLGVRVDISIHKKSISISIYCEFHYICLIYSYSVYY